MKRLISIILLMTCFFSSGFGQKARKVRAKFGSNGSDGLLQLANGYYAEGNYDSCIAVIDRDLVRSLIDSKKNREAVLVLKANALIEKDELEGADAAAIAIYKNNPHYELVDADHTEDYNRLMKRFDVYPLLTIGIRNALLFPKFKTTKTYSVLGNVDYNAPYVGPKTILMYYGWLEYEFSRNFSINVEGTTFFIQYNRNFVKSGTDWNMNYNETMNFFEIPICLKRYLFIDNTYCYAALGLGYLRMTKALGTAYITYSGQDIFTGENIAYSDYDENMNVLPMRNTNNLECIGGVGIGYKFKNVRICADYKFYRGLNSLTNSKARFENETLINDYFYIDNSVKYNKYEIGVSLSYVLKNTVKKIKK
jgi:hypothetical protein